MSPIRPHSEEAAPWRPPSFAQDEVREREALAEAQIRPRADRPGAHVIVSKREGGHPAPLELPEVCLGGGLGVAYVEGEEAPSITEWAGVLRRA